MQINNVEHSSTNSIVHITVICLINCVQTCVKFGYLHFADPVHGLPQWTTEMDYQNGLLNGLPTYLQKKRKDF